MCDWVYMDTNPEIYNLEGAKPIIDFYRDLFDEIEVCCVSIKNGQVSGGGASMAYCRNNLNVDKDETVEFRSWNGTHDHDIVGPSSVPRDPDEQRVEDTPWLRQSEPIPWETIEPISRGVLRYLIDKFGREVVVVRLVDFGYGLQAVCRIRDFTPQVSDWFTCCVGVNQSIYWHQGYFFDFPDEEEKDEGKGIIEWLESFFNEDIVCIQDMNGYEWSSGGPAPFYLAISWSGLRCSRTEVRSWKGTHNETKWYGPYKN